VDNKIIASSPPKTICDLCILVIGLNNLIVFKYALGRDILT
jgi:hypothetical protein